MARGSRGGGPAPCSPASRRSPPGPRGRPPPSEGRARCPQVSGPWWGSRGVCVGGGSGLLPRSRSRLAWAHVAAAAPPEDARASEGTLPPSPATTSAAVLGGARRGAARYGRGMAAEAVSAPPTPPAPVHAPGLGEGAPARGRGHPPAGAGEVLLFPQAVRWLARRCLLQAVDRVQM